MEQLLMDVSDYSPVLPDSVTQLLLSRAGLDTESDPRVARIAALAAQKVSYSRDFRTRGEREWRVFDILVFSLSRIYCWMPSNARKIDKTKNELKIGTVLQKRNFRPTNIPD